MYFFKKKARREKISLVILGLGPYVILGLGPYVIGCKSNIGVFESKKNFLKEWKMLISQEMQKQIQK